jgi:hypothetical protein
MHVQAVTLLAANGIRHELAEMSSPAGSGGHRARWAAGDASRAGEGENVDG